MAKEFKLPKGIKTGWLQALRSGEYNQARHVLRHSAGYCCLGVLADAAGALDSTGKCIPTNLGAREGKGSYYGLKTSDADQAPRLVLPKRVQDRLMEMNDDAGKSFEEIANWIEENL